MTRDDINDWFLEAQKIPRHSPWVWKLDTYQLMQFFDRVVEEAHKQKKVAVSKAIAKERKACARIADTYGGPKEPMMVGDMEAGAYNAAEAIAADIRARGDK